MDPTIATVIDLSGRDAVVRVEGVACPRCAAGNGCGAAIFAQSRGTTTLTARVADSLQVAPGDRVELSVADRSLLRAACYVYGAPLLGLLLASALVHLLSEASNDWVALSWGTVGLFAGAAAGRVLARRDACVSGLRPTVCGRAGGPGREEMAP